ncbi:TVP38/TMEM64 family protein [Paenibacillus cymbidii]|uniref:TVP38/TMEM64 family protein n=1 Tax=Paenibacillus cymbidii TaxID=1639034 RepID=UPI0010808D66|nr:TVP38/TMEM64 family protein [Paenibacillus cymbidii]
MNITDITSYMTEEHLLELLERYRELGPLPGIFVAFLKSFVPPLPTFAIIGLNAAVYGFWLGTLYSWLGLVLGCVTTFLIVRRLSWHPYWRRWAEKPKVTKGMRWIRRNAFGYVFVLSMFPIGPFVVINIAAGLARMRLMSFLIAVSLGKIVMVMAVSYVGDDWQRFVRHPEQLLVVALFIALSIFVSRRIEARYTREDGEAQEPDAQRQN